jgi:hypothetical protein
LCYGIYFVYFSREKNIRNIFSKKINLNLKNEKYGSNEKKKSVRIVLVGGSSECGKQILTTNYFAGKHQKDGFNRELQYPTAYAKFSDVKSGLETDFTLAAELTVHSVVHVKTQSKAKMAFSQDPFFEFFLDVLNTIRNRRLLKVQDQV